MTQPFRLVLRKLGVNIAVQFWVRLLCRVSKPNEVGLSSARLGRDAEWDIEDGLT